MFDQSPPAETHRVPPQATGRGLGLSPGDDYNQRADWEDILTPHGWVRAHTSGDKVHWLRPGKDSGWSATTGCRSKSGNDLFCVFSTNALPFEGGSPCSSYSKFAAYTLLVHSGDYSAAAKQLASEGYGDKTPNTNPPGPVVTNQATEPAEVKVLPVKKYSLSELTNNYPRLNSPVVDGLFREGETVNVVSVSKAGKSWLVYNLALSIITGKPWLGNFDTTAGKVLLIDNELHPSVLAHRIPKVCEAMGVFPADVNQGLEVWPLRGNLRSLQQLAVDLQEKERGHFKAIILDAKYRFATEGASENDNGAETLFYNMVDQIAEKTGAAIVMIHHSSKGSQSEKRPTDVGSGAGAQSRAADCHIVLREHEVEGAFVLDAAVRSFAPIEPIALRWSFPLWTPADSIDPKRLMGVKTPAESRRQQNDQAGKDKIVSILLEGPETNKQLQKLAGMGRERLNRLLSVLVFDNQIDFVEEEVEGNKCDKYHLIDTQKQGGRVGEPPTLQPTGRGGGVWVPLKG